MKTKGEFWRIECRQHSKTVFETKIKIKDISEKKLVQFIRVLMSKYALSDSEILEEHLRIPFKTRKEYIIVHKFQNLINDILHLGYHSQSSDISVSAFLSQ